MYIFELHGVPVPQKQTRFSCIGGRPRAYDPSKKDLEMIRWQVKPNAPKEPLKGPIELRLTFYLPIPKHTSRVKRTQMINRVILPVVKPDEDNLAYLVTNALKGIVYEDDRQICKKVVYKYYGEEPKTVIEVRVIQTALHYGLQEPHADDF